MRRLLGTVDAAGFYRPSCLLSLLVAVGLLVPWVVGVWWLISCAMR